MSELFHDPVMRKIIGALKSTINDHGPITRELITSAAKRIYGHLKEQPNGQTTTDSSGTTEHSVAADQAQNGGVQ